VQTFLHLHEEFDPFFEENIERIKEKTKSKEFLISEDIADINKILFSLRHVIDF